MKILLSLLVGALQACSHSCKPFLAVLLLAGISIVGVAAGIEHLPTVELEVYAAFLSKSARDIPQGKILVIRDTSESIDVRRSNAAELKKAIRKSLPQASDSVIEDFVKVSESQQHLNLSSIRLASRADYSLMSDTAYASLFRDNSLRKGWRRFQVRYPDSPSGYIQLSRVGLDPASRQALVYVRFYCGPSSTCGAAYLILFERQSSEWVELNSELWVIS